MHSQTQNPATTTRAFADAQPGNPCKHRVGDYFQILVPQFNGLPPETGVLDQETPKSPELTDLFGDLPAKPVRVDAHECAPIHNEISPRFRPRKNACPLGRDKNGHRIHTDRPCEQCGVVFTPTESHGKVGRFCSRDCRCESRRGIPIQANQNFITPESTKAQRIAANGLVNMRIKRGEFKTPNLCQKCGGQKKLDKHHPDYSKPDEVLFLCRSCHMAGHHYPETISGLKPVRVDVTRKPRVAVPA